MNEMAVYNNGWRLWVVESHDRFQDGGAKRSYVRVKLKLKGKGKDGIVGTRRRYLIYDAFFLCAMMLYRRYYPQESQHNGVEH